jgi:zinc protease
LTLFALAACGSSQPSRTIPAPPATVNSAEAAPTPVAEKVPAGPDVNRRLPLDPLIRRTVLKNGLTVYVMPHKKPEQRAQLWLAVNAGSVLEDDDQQGLAHFVEHMCFNGTKRFEKQAIVDFIEKVGMRFGADVNAYTSFDQTVYMLTVPTDDQKTMLTGLDILRDWSHDVSFDPKEVDKERGVVTEEWRLGRDAWTRIWDKQRPITFAGSRYAQRSPIGLPEILKSAPRDALVRFYKDWYQPQNMAVIAVGDFDADQMQKEIETRFGDLAATPNAKVRTPVPVPHDQPTAVTIVQDKEMPYSQVSIMQKMDHRSESRWSDHRRWTVEALYHTMVQARFSELAQDPDAPFMWAGSSTGELARTADNFSRFAVAKEGHTAEALTALVKEVRRVEQFGFTQTELDRAKADFLTNADSSAKEWDKSQSRDVADEMTRNFFTDENMEGRIADLANAKEMLPTITLDELNHLAANWGGETGRVIALSGPTTAKMPTEAEVRELYTKALAAPVEAWKDAPARPLMTAMPQAGKVVATAHDASADATVWTLSNGVKVIVKPTAFQNDDITIQGWKKGGLSVAKDLGNARFASDVAAAGGVGDLDPVALRKALQGKNVSVWPQIDELSEGVYTNTRPADLETALQLQYLKLTAPRRDERLFDTWRKQQVEWVKNRRLDPDTAFYEDVTAIETKNHPLRTPTTPEMIGKVSLDKSLAIFHDRFADFSGATFTIVGNVDPATLQPLVEQYIGSLPSKNGKATAWKDPRITWAAGKVNKTLEAGTEPRSMVSMWFSAPDKWSKESEADAKILGMVLRIRLREVLREDMGGVYGVRSYVAIDREPTQRRTLAISFGCDPQNVDKLRKAALDVMHELTKEGANATNIEKVTEQLKRGRETDSKENWWWSRQLHDAYWYGDDFGQITDLSPVLSRVTSDNIKMSAKRFFDEKNQVFYVLRPTVVAAPAAAATPGKQ